jgi:hypothetical protein
MTVYAKVLGVAVSMLAMAAIVIGCASSAESMKERGVSNSNSTSVSSLMMPSNGLVQSSDGGAVTIDVEWKGAFNESLVFAVAMNTHSVDLDQYNLGELAVLRDDDGREYRPASWSSELGGHHRRGTLTFNLPESLIQGGTEHLQLMIRDVAGIPKRVMEWKLE